LVKKIGENVEKNIEKNIENIENVEKNIANWLPKSGGGCTLASLRGTAWNISLMKHQTRRSASG
jgi:hypothetical protein